jgi:L-aspartate oxidase
VPGLWACGECASTGLHGANRLASNSLLEALVLGARVGESLSSALLVSPDPVACVDLARSVLGGWTSRDPAPDAERIAVARQRLREIMWTRVGVERDAAGLTRALAELGELEAVAVASGTEGMPGPVRHPAGDRRTGELRNMIEVARLVARSALARTESRGAHFRSDIPVTSPHWQQDVLFEGTRLLPPVARPAAEVV